MPLLAIAIEYGGDELRVELELSAVGVVLEGNDLRDPIPGKFYDARFLAEIRLRSGEDLDGVGPRVKPAHGIATGFAVPAAPQIQYNLGWRNLVTYADHARRRKNLGRVGERSTL